MILRSSVAVAALLVIAMAAGGCGEQTPRADGSANRASPGENDSGRIALTRARQAEVVAAAADRVSLLRDPPALSAADRHLLARAVPAQLPLIFDHTASAGDKYWVAPGLVTPDDAPGVCVFERVAVSGGTAVGSYCFDLKTIDRGGAYLQVPTSKGREIVGVAPRGVSALRVGAESKATACPVAGGIYVCRSVGRGAAEVRAKGALLYVMEPMNRPASG